MPTGAPGYRPHARLARILGAKQTTIDLAIATDDEAAEGLFRGWESLPCPTAFVAWDYYQNARGRLARDCVFPLFDHIFLLNAELVDSVAQRHPSVHWCPPGVDPEIDRDLGLPRDLDIGIVGGLNPDFAMRHLLMRELAARYRTNDLFRSYTASEITAIYNRSRIVVNLMPDRTRTFSYRILEAMASGALVISERGDPGIERVFTPGIHLELFDSTSELYALIDRYLANDSERGRMARAGQELVHRDCRWDQRAEQILSVVAAAGSARPAPARAMRPEAVLRLYGRAYMRRRKVDAILELFDSAPPPPWAWAFVARALLSHVGVHRGIKRQVSTLFARLRLRAHGRRTPAQPAPDGGGRSADSESEPPGSPTRVFVWSYIDRGVEAIVSLAFMVLIVRQLGPSGYSAFAALLSVTIVTLTLTSFGSSEVLALSLPAFARLGNTSAGPALIQRVLLTRVALLAVVAAIMYGWRGPLAAILNAPELTSTTVWMPLLIALGVGELCLASAAAYLSPRRMAVARLAGALVQLASALALFSALGVRFTWALVATTVSWFTVSGVLLAYDKRPLAAWHPPPPLREGARRQALLAWAASLVTAAAFPAATTLALSVLGVPRSVIGFYFAASALATRLLSLATMALGPVTVSLAARARNPADWGASRRVWLSAQCVYLVVLLPVLGLATINAGLLVRTLMSGSFDAATPLLRVGLMLSLIAGVVGNVPSYWVLTGSGRSGMSLGAMTGAAIANGVILLFLVPRIGAMGATVANGCAQIVAGLLLTGAATKVLGPLDFPWKLLTLLTISLMAAAVVSSLAPTGSLAAGAMSLVSWLAVLGVGAAVIRPLPAGLLATADGGRFARALRRFESRPVVISPSASSFGLRSGGAR